MRLLIFLVPVFAAASDFPLEDYISADFHRRYLSATPSLSWVRNGFEETGMGQEQERESRGVSHGIQATYGSTRYSQSIRWDATTGASYHGGENDWENEGMARDIQNFPILSANSSRYESRSYRGFSRLSGQWYAIDRLFLGLSGEADLLYSTGTDGSAGWVLNLARGVGDSTAYQFTEQDWENKGLVASLGVRPIAGFGRLQDVTFAETGLFLLDRLSEAVGKPVQLTPEGMRELEAYVETRRRGGLTVRPGLPRRGRRLSTHAEDPPVAPQPLRPGGLALVHGG